MYRIINVEPYSSYLEGQEIKGVAQEQRFVVPKDEISYQDIDWAYRYPRTVKEIIEKGFQAVILREEDGVMVISRRKWQQEKYDAIQIGDVMKGMISGITSYGLFITFEGGLNCMIHCTEVSRAHIGDLTKCNTLFWEGQDIKVLIIGKKIGNRLIASRKALYPSFKEMEGCFKRGDILEAVPTKRLNADGCWAEIFPNVSGIINDKSDVISEIEIGKPVLVTVQSIKRGIGLKLKLLY